MKVIDYLDWEYRYGQEVIGPRRQDPFYVKHFPLREVSRCPYCQEPLLYRLDTWSIIDFWCHRDCPQALHGIDNYKLSGQNYSRCQHLFVTDMFMNFHGWRPGRRRLEGMVDINGYACEVPGIMPEYMAARRCDIDMYPLFFTQEPGKPIRIPDPIQLYEFYWQRVAEKGESLPLVDIKAVISSFPVMRPTYGGFKPAYTAYLLTYYIGDDNPQFTATKNYGDSGWHAIDWVHDKYPLDNRTTYDNMYTATLDYNLLPYAERGQLLWWDEEGLHSLNGQPKSSFPYRHRIRGRKKYFELPENRIYNDPKRSIPGAIDYGSQVRPRLHGRALQ